ncbi:MAG: DNA polymerase III subunit beta [Pseudomonadota bacterium]
MLFKIEREKLLEALARITPIAEKRSPLPILSHVLIETMESTLKLSATDLEVGLQVFLGCESQDAGQIAAPAKKMFEIVRELASGTLTVEQTESGRITISSGHSVFHLAGMDPGDYPAWASFEDMELSPINAGRFVRMIDKTLFAASTDDSRHNLNSVLLEPEEEQVRMVATDGHRLAMMVDSLKLPVVERTLIPRKSLTEMKRVLEGVSDKGISVGFDRKNMVIRTERFLMTLRLLDGEYPDYNKVLPDTGEHVVRADRARLVQSLKRVAVLSSDRNRGVDVTVGPGRLECMVTHPDLGNAKDVMEVDYDGDEFPFMVNVGYLLEALGVIDSEQISLEYLSEKAPIVLRPYPAETYFNLVMPMRK